jgi:hypothetical protein
MEPTTGIEPVNLFLTKEVLYRLSYVGKLKFRRFNFYVPTYFSQSAILCLERFEKCGAGNGTRTRDVQLGRLTLYQLSYSRRANKKDRAIGWWRGEDSNLRRRRQQIYSLPPLATREPLHDWSWRWDSNPQPADYKSAALPVELRQQTGPL